MSAKMLGSYHLIQSTLVTLEDNDYLATPITNKLFCNLDAQLTTVPTSICLRILHESSSAFPIGEKIDDPIEMYLCDLFTVGANLACVPAISLPAGLDEQGLPIAIQLHAPVLEESRLLFAGHAFQATTEHHKLRPPHFGRPAADPTS